jgi:hypothetical protein
MNGGEALSLHDLRELGQSRRRAPLLRAVAAMIEEPFRPLQH